MKVVFMSVALGVLVIGASGSAAADKPATEAGTDAVHASLVAYPNAVIVTNDVATGITIAVEPNGHELKATAKDGTVLWKVDVLKAWGRPAMGSAVIRHLAIRGEKIQVTVGKHMGGEVDLKTGKAVLIGEG